MTKQTTVRLPDELANRVEAVARAQEASVDQVIVNALQIEIDRVRNDVDFQARVKRLVVRDREILDRLAK